MAYTALGNLQYRSKFLAYSSLFWGRLWDGDSAVHSSSFGTIRQEDTEDFELQIKAFNIANIFKVWTAYLKGNGVDIKVFQGVYQQSGGGFTDGCSLPSMKFRTGIKS